ncbi:unnamed protein product, partial [Allacma fusca]
ALGAICAVNFNKLNSFRNLNPIRSIGMFLRYLQIGSFPFKTGVAAVVKIVFRWILDLNKIRVLISGKNERMTGCAIYWIR